MTLFLSNLANISTQVLILFILMLIGFICGKANIINGEAAKRISDFCLKFTTPCVIIRSFMNSKLNPNASVSGLLMGLLAAVICHIIAVLVAQIIFNDKDPKRKALFRGSSALANAGFMGLPLQAALLGSMGEFYGATSIFVMTFTLWTYGFVTMSSGTEKMSLKKALINPGVIAIIIGLPLFLFLPETLISNTDSFFYKTIYTCVNHIANCNTPVPMIVVGFYLSQSKIFDSLKDKKCMLSIATKLLIIPFACIGVLYLLRTVGVPFDSTILVSAIISISTPIAVAVTMFAAKFDGETALSANMVSVSTLLSIITMPPVIATAMTLFN